MFVPPRCAAGPAPQAIMLLPSTGRVQSGEQAPAYLQPNGAIVELINQTE
jgi:hypothetical protein